MRPENFAGTLEKPLEKPARRTQETACDVVLGQILEGSVHIPTSKVNSDVNN